MVNTYIKYLKRSIKSPDAFFSFQDLFVGVLKRKEESKEPSERGLGESFTKIGAVS